MWGICSLCSDVNGESMFLCSSVALSFCCWPNIQLMCFLPEWESCSRGPVWLQALLSGAALQSAGCSHSRGRRHSISIWRGFTPLTVDPPAACRAAAKTAVISEWSSLMWSNRWKKVEAAGYITLWTEAGCRTNDRGRETDSILSKICFITKCIFFSF